MCIIGELALLVLGIFTIVNGAFRLSRDRVVWGVPARIIGALLLLPLFVLFGTVMIDSVIWSVQNRQPNDQDARQFVITVLAIEVTILLVALAIALTMAEPVEGDKRSENGDSPSRDDLPSAGEQ